MKKEFKVAIRVIPMAKQDILTVSYGNVDPEQKSNGMEAPGRMQHSVTDFD